MKSKLSYSASRIDDNHWGLSIQKSLKNLEQNKARVALHYVLDNSLSMGNMTIQVRDIFSEMVDSVATAPCSLTVFKGDAEVLSSTISTGQQMRELELPSQGKTNISAGIQKALRIIYGQEMAFKARNKQKLKNNGKDRKIMSKTNHILILLSDGEHNSGPPPTDVFPSLSWTLPEDVYLSVVIVGYSRHSNTSMGMLLKESIETVAFDAETVQTIYFSKTKTALRGALENLEAGLNSALQGSFHEIETIDQQAVLVENLNDGLVSKLRMHVVSAGMASFSFLCCADEPPESLFVDNEKVNVNIEEQITAAFLSQLIQNLINKTKIQIVAAKNRVAMAKDCANKLEDLVEALEAKDASEKTLNLGSVSPKERIKQYRKIRAVCFEAKELRNQILDIANFSSGESEKAANFLNGRSMKYASKALRRAAKKSSGDNVIDPMSERKVILKELVCDTFHAGLRLAMQLDVMHNLARLDDFQFSHVLVPSVQRLNESDAKHLQRIRKILQNQKEQADFTKVLDADLLSQSSKDLIMSGKLYEYLNSTFHGNRVSYLSLSNPFQHILEWLEFNEQTFESTWEMLMYAGFIGYPITVERSSASQMNPFLINVRAIHPSLADSASICCANQAEIPVYGPEAGEPITDILTLIDPSMPRSSKMIYSGKLLGEKYISAVVSRDLHMYTGVNMRIALHGNSIFHFFADVEKKQQEDVVANLRRAFLGRAFMCSSCGFGPVDHFACSDLHAHHGETYNRKASVDNSCPRCGWFSSSLYDWEPWDGNVCLEFIDKEFKLKPSGVEHHITEFQVDLILRILYSFPMMVSLSPSKRDEYKGIMQRFMKDGNDLDLSVRSGIDGMSQIPLAILCPSYWSEVMGLEKALNSKDYLISLIREACYREAKKNFLVKSKGDKEKSKQLAISYLTALLGIDENSAPCTMSEMESEPPIENVRSDCDDSYELDLKLVKQEINWVRQISNQWSRVWSFARGFCEVMITSKITWDDIERRMETGLSSYQFIIKKLKTIDLENCREILGMDAAEVQSFFLRIGVEAIYTGVLDRSLRSSSAPHLDTDVLNMVAREMRMIVYLNRVKGKMAKWKEEGQSLVYFSAKAADIAQFSDMLPDGHVHGLDKPSFWGLWKAAKNTKNSHKIALFVQKANECFVQKHWL